MNVALLGSALLAAAMLASLTQAAAGGWAAWRDEPRARWLMRGMVQAQCLLVLAAFVALAWLFLQDDFSVVFVAGNSHVDLPWYYKLSAVWGGHEGSLLLWMLMLSGWTAAVSRFSRHLPARTIALVLAVLGLVAVGFYSFTLFTSNPFDLQFPAARAGRDLNPLLQDPGMIFHPPLLYMGYVGFAVAFAFAIAALIEGRLDSQWARWTRPWTTAAWAFLTGGIMLGSWWAYHELGWGGWWFWDPVENASFMPWLIGTALIHSLAVTDQRGVFKSWTVLLAIVAFSLSLLGTFMVRSGVLTSVHSFASDPERGAYILAFLALTVGGALTLYAWRAAQLKPERRIAWLSRESAILVNNIFLTILAAVVFIGTLYPLAVEAFGGGTISVGPPYFEAMFVPFGLPLALLIGFAASLAWKRARGRDLRPLLGVAAVAGVAGVALWISLYSARGAMALAGILLGIWAMAAAVHALWRRAREGRGLAGIPAAFWGMNLAHFGIGMFVLAVTVVSAYDLERDLRMAPGESTEVAGFTLSFAGTRHVSGPNYEAEQALVRVSRNGEPVATLRPEKRIYRVQREAMTQSAVDHNPLRDVYLSLGEPMGGGAWSLRVQVKPMMRLVWAGCVFMLLGGLIAASDRRYRRATAHSDRRTELRCSAGAGLASAAQPVPQVPQAPASA